VRDVPDFPGIELEIASEIIKELNAQVQAEETAKKELADDVKKLKEVKDHGQSLRRHRFKIQKSVV
jgi:hypothetical protein